MTYDKFVHYLGLEIVNFIDSLNLEQLEKMKAAISTDINTITHDSKTLFLRTIELQYINNRLK